MAGILWDLVDSADDYRSGTDDDDLAIPFDTLWTILRTHSRDFTEVYEKLLAHYKAEPDTMEKINQILIAHDFFVETSEGNRRHDADWEPYFDGSTKERKASGE